MMAVWLTNNFFSLQNTNATTTIFKQKCQLLQTDHVCAMLLMLGENYWYNKIQVKASYHCEDLSTVV